MKERSFLSSVLIVIFCFVFAVACTAVFITVLQAIYGLNMGLALIRLGLEMLMLCYCYLFASFTSKLKDPSVGTVGLLIVSFLAVSLLIFYSISSV